MTEPALGRRFSRWVGGGVLIIALVGLTAGYITLLRAPAAGTFHDDGIYLVTAKALAEDQGYRIVSLPGEPPQTKYPILFPWLLSLVWRLDPSFPANLPWLRLVPLLATLAWLCLSWPLLRRLGASTAQASAIVLLTAISPWVAFLSTALMSETVFALFLTAGLLMITRACQENGRRIDPFIAGILFGAAALTRIAGIAPAAAAVAVFLGARRWLSAVQCLFGSAVVIVPWFWWVSGQPTAAVDAYYSAANYASWNIVTSYTWPEKVSVLVRNAGFASLAFTEIWGLRVPYAVPSLLVAVTALTIMCCGLWRTRREPVAIAMLAYCAIHAAWVWPPLRFAVPVTPLMLWFAFQGAGKPRRFGWAAAMVLFVAGGLQLCATVAQAREKGVVYPVSNAENWDDTERLLKWISRETPADATLTGHLDAMYYLFTGRKAARAFSTDPYLLFYDAGRRSENPLGTVDDFRSRLLTMKADYVIVTAPSRSGEVAHLRQLVDELAKRCPGSLSLAAGNVGSGYAIYKTDRLVLERPETCAKHEGLVQGDFWSYGRGVDGGGQSRP